MPKCPYCGSDDLTRCVKIVTRHTNLGPLYRWMQVLIDRHDSTNVEVWFYPTWLHGMNGETIRKNAEYLLLMKND